MRDLLLNIGSLLMSTFMLQEITDILFFILLILQVVVLAISIIKTIKSKEYLTTDDLNEINDQIENLKGVIKNEREKE